MSSAGQSSSFLKHIANGIINPEADETEGPAILL